MKLFVICCLCAYASAASLGDYSYAAPKVPALYSAPLRSISPPVVAAVPAVAAVSPIQQQYFTQDAFGQYSYGYTEPLSTKQEVRTLDGVTRGSYSYLDAEGKIQTVDYVADADGFRVAATNLPKPLNNDLPQQVQDTPEVMAARDEHLKAFKQVSLRTSGDYMNLLQSVQDTPEVAAAKVEFFKRYEEEKQRHQLLNQKNNLVAIPSVIVPSSSLGYNYKLAIAKPERNYLPSL